MMETLLDADVLPGKRVRITATKNEGSARVLDGLIATVLAPHPIAAGWSRIELDCNERTEHRMWTIPNDTLVVVH